MFLGFLTLDLINFSLQQAFWLFPHITGTSGDKGDTFLWNFSTGILKMEIRVFSRKSVISYLELTSESKKCDP